MKASTKQLEYKHKIANKLTEIIAFLKKTTYKKVILYVIKAILINIEELQVTMYNGMQ